MYSLFLSMRNQAPWRRKEIVRRDSMLHRLLTHAVLLQVLLIAIACIGWVTNHFSGTKFVNQNDISAAVG